MENCDQPTFWISLVFMIALLVLGLVATAYALFGKTADDARPRASAMLEEKEGSNAGDISFARVAGTIGALSLASLFIVTLFWVQHELFCGGSLTAAKELWLIYLYGTALFAPYAFNRLAQIGK